MTVMAKVITSAEICENAKMARDMALAGAYQFLLLKSIKYQSCAYFITRTILAFFPSRELWWREHLLWGINSIDATIYCQYQWSNAKGQVDNGKYISFELDW